MPQAYLQLVFRTTQLLSPNYCMPPLLGYGASQKLATETDLRLFVLRRTGKSRYLAGQLAVSELCEQVDDKLISCLEIQLCSPLHRLLPQSAVNHTSPVAVYIITFSPHRQLLSMNVILSVAYKVKSLIKCRV